MQRRSLTQCDAQYSASIPHPQGVDSRETPELPNLLDLGMALLQSRAYGAGVNTFCGIPVVAWWHPCEHFQSRASITCCT